MVKTDSAVLFLDGRAAVWRRQSLIQLTDERKSKRSNILRGNLSMSRMCGEYITAALIVLYRRGTINAQSTEIYFVLTCFHQKR